MANLSATKGVLSQPSFWLIGGLALVLRLTALVTADRPAELFHLPDSAEYDQLGWNIAQHGRYSLAEGPPWAPDLTRTPVYPLFVAGCYLLAGRSPTVVAAVQAGLGALTCLIVFALAYRSWGRGVAIASATLLAVDPLSVRYSHLVLSETLFTLLFMASVYYLLGYCSRPSVLAAAKMSLLTGLAILCRPIALFWPGAVILFFALVAWRQRRWRPLVHCALFCGLVAAAFAPWIVRNSLTGAKVLSTVQGINLYYHRAAAVVAWEENIPIDEARQQLKRQFQEAVRKDNLDDRQQYQWMEQTGMRIIRDAPGHYLWVHGQGILRMFAWDNWQTSFFALPARSVTILEASYLVVLYILAALGLVLGLRGSRPLDVLVLAAVIVYFAVLSGPEAYVRFRVPVMPALVLMAALGLTAREAPKMRTPITNC